MLLSDQLSKSNLHWLSGWISWPILAYWASCATGFLLMFVFPITLTIAQWYVLKNRVGNRYPTYWFLVLVIYLLVYYAMPRVRIGADQSIGYSGAVVEFYMIQCAAELLLFSMFSNWKLGWYTAGNLLACSIWYAIFNFSSDHSYRMTDNLWLYVIIPAIAFFTNVITGYGLLKATEA